MFRSLSAIVACTLLSTAAVAADPTLSFDLPKESLADALRALGIQANINVLFDPPVVAGRVAPALKARVTSKEALTRLLKDTGLEYEFVSDKTVAIRLSAAQKTSSAAPGVASHSPSASAEPAREGQEYNGDSIGGLRLAQTGQGPVSSDSSVAASDAGKAKKQAVTLEEIVVTGSRLPQVAKQGAQEVRSYSRDQIEQSGQGTVADFLSTLPEVSVMSTDGPNSFSYANQTTVQLHGLPKGTTLVLLNGQRVEINNYGYFDLNNIPVSAIERIDVLPVGSSAIYGADGLAGAVNIILKRQLNGFEANAKYGHDAGSDETDESVAWGMSGDRGSLYVSGYYQDKSGLLGSQRAATSGLGNGYATAYHEDDLCNPGTVYSLNGGNLPGLASGVAAIPSHLSGVPTQAAFQATAGTANKCSAWGTADMLSPVRRTGSLLTGRWRLSDSVELFTDVLFSHEEVNSQVGSLLNESYDGYGSTLPASNAYNPFGQAVGIGYTSTAWNYYYDRTTNFIRPLVGVRGGLGGDWTYEVSGFLSQDRSLVVQNSLNSSAVATALASSNPATSLNLFTTGAPGSPALLASLLDPQYLQYNSKNVTAQAVLRGTVLTLPSGPLSLAVGTEYDHSEIFTHSADAGASEVSAPVTAKRSAYSLFAESRIPLIANHRGSGSGETLAITGAVRYDDTDDYGDKTTEQGGIEWRPTETLLIRGGYATSYQAPQLTELSGAATAYTYTGAADPYRGNQGIGNINVTTGPSPALRPETGWSRELGLVYSSTALQGLEVSLTYWQIHIQDYIAIPNIQDLIDYPKLYPGAVTRAAPTAQDIASGYLGAITSINDAYNNFGDLDVAGVDFDAHYTSRTRFGDFTPTLSVTETLRYDSALTPGQAASDYLGQANYNIGFAPRWKGTLALGWRQGPLAASLDGRYTGSYNDYLTFGGPPSHDIGNFWYCDANVRYAIGESTARDNKWLRGTYIEVGGVNLMNRMPNPSTWITGYDYQEADIRGRFLYAQVGVRL